MIDINKEHLVSAWEVPNLLPPRATCKKVHISAVQRGVRGVKLEAVKIGGTTYTSKEAIEHCATDLTRQPSLRCPSTFRTREMAQAARQVDRIYGK